MISKMLRSAAHDIKNLLSPVFLYSEMVEENPDSAQNREHARMILMKAEEINRYLDAVRLLYHEGAWHEEGSFSLLAKKLVLLTETIFKSHEKSLFIRYFSGLEILKGDLSGNGFALLSELIAAAEDDKDIAYKDVWLVARTESDKLGWKIFLRQVESRQKVQEQVLGLPDRELLRLEASLGEPFATIGA